MKNKTILKIILFVSPILFFAGLIPSFPESFHIFCKGYFDCVDTYKKYENIGVIISLLSPFVFLTAFYFSVSVEVKKIMKSWGVFSAVFWVFGIFIISGTSDSGFSPVSGKAVTMFFLVIFYAIISLILIIYKSIKLRGK